MTLRLLLRIQVLCLSCETVRRDLTYICMYVMIVIRHNYLNSLKKVKQRIIVLFLSCDSLAHLASVLCTLNHLAKTRTCVERDATHITLCNTPPSCYQCYNTRIYCFRRCPNSPNVHKPVLNVHDCYRMLKCDAEICWNVEYRGIVTFCDMPGQVQEAQEQARGFRIPEDVHAGPIWK
jgi:hypothetical protein